MTSVESTNVAMFPGVKPIVLCFSHLRWDFVFQRPQHLMSQLAHTHHVIVWEEPIIADGDPWLQTIYDGRYDIHICKPHLPNTLAVDERDAQLEALLIAYLKDRPVKIRWYYTPMMLPFSKAITAKCIVYDCMDELSAFRFAPPDLLTLETALLDCADLVFTGGHSLYEAKHARHHSVRLFPSSVDIDHFAAARPITRRRGEAPRLGFFGVIDERMDLELLAALAKARPNWTIEVVGPIVKIDPAALPSFPNLFFEGPRTYDQLPIALSRWDVALMPFAINEATRFISPTKTPEYLAGGRPVVSTPIADVVRTYGHLEGVKIGDSAVAFIARCDEALALAEGDDSWLAPVDALLSAMSWQETASEMMLAIETVISGKRVNVGGRARDHFDYVVVGAGFAGAVMAERLAQDGGYRVLVVDRRPHVAGNAYDRLDAAGILIHQYGPHIFHTNSDEIVAYLSRFTQWHPYEHKVLADLGSMRVPMPINRTTLNMLYGEHLCSDAEATAFLAARAEPIDDVRTAKDAVVASVGDHLYRTFFRGYTRKQWGVDPSELDKTVTARVPARCNTDDRYFTDSFQAMPAAGYTKMFQKMLDHPGIELRLGVEFDSIRNDISYDSLVFTGPVDEFFGHRYGKLPYRSLEFRHETIDQEWLQSVGVVNYPDEAVPFTRVTEYKHLTGQKSAVTSVTYEYPAADGAPYYPIPRTENQALYKRYEALTLAEPNVLFVGRLATYRYYNMDQVVGQALATYRRLRANRSNDKSVTTAKRPDARRLDKVRPTQSMSRPGGVSGSP